MGIGMKEKSGGRWRGSGGAWRGEGWGVGLGLEWHKGGVFKYLDREGGLKLAPS